MLDNGFWRGRKVMVTGHMGFKGSWLIKMLSRLGAVTVGFGLDARPDPLLYRQLSFDNHVGIEADVNDAQALKRALSAHEVETVFHLAAQPLVLDSYADPLATFSSNIMGAASVLEAIRHSSSVAAAVIVTSDKVYENREWHWPYREQDRLGGKDPYSASKAAAEIVTRSMIDSFFKGNAARIATARAGNVIGGGDWAKNRLIPDGARAYGGNRVLTIRQPRSVRPWQHVLDPLVGYLALAEHLLDRGRPLQHHSWNFGPEPGKEWKVGEVIELFTSHWGPGARWETPEPPSALPHEAGLLSVDSSLARHWLGWTPAWDTAEAIGRTARWYRGYFSGESAQSLTERDLDEFLDRSPTRLPELADA